MAQGIILSPEAGTDKLLVQFGKDTPAVGFCHCGGPADGSPVQAADRCACDPGEHGHTYDEDLGQIQRALSGWVSYSKDKGLAVQSMKQKEQDERLEDYRGHGNTGRACRNLLYLKDGRPR
ncbi:MAG: hypothetical protein ACLTW9_30965 [Enterocloster sp.]